MKNKEGYWVKAMFLCASYPWLDGYLVKASAFVCKSFMALWGDLILERVRWGIGIKQMKVMLENHLTK